MTIQRANFDITIYRGDTHIEDFLIYEDEAKTKPVDLSNTEITGMARIGPNDVKWFDLPISIIDAKAGHWAISFSATESTALGKAGETHTGSFDIQSKVGDEVFTFAVGKVTITDDYTYKG